MQLLSILFAHQLTLPVILLFFVFGEPWRSVFLVDCCRLIHLASVCACTCFAVFAQSALTEPGLEHNEAGYTSMYQGAVGKLLLTDHEHKDQNKVGLDIMEAHNRFCTFINTA